MPSTKHHFIFELSGEHPTLPHAEVIATSAAEAPDHLFISSGPGYIILRMTRPEASSVGVRLALCHRIGEVIGFVGDETPLRMDAIPDGTIALRVRRYQEQSPEIDANQLIRTLGGALAIDRKVDLEDPQVEIRALISDRIIVHVKLMEIDRRQFERRAVKERPYFSPISLHPKYARALINLTQVKSGQTILDPFCGTGGTLLEASLLGLKVYGSDLSGEMIGGCRQNLEHFGLEADRLEVLDIGSIGDMFGEVEAIVTDPPYGRAASTNKEELDALYKRSMLSMRDCLAIDGRLGIVFPRPVDFPSGLILEQTHLQKVHRSLTRHYFVTRRPSQ